MQHVKHKNLVIINHTRTYNWISNCTCSENLQPCVHICILCIYVFILYALSPENILNYFIYKHLRENSSILKCIQTFIDSVSAWQNVSLTCLLGLFVGGLQTTWLSVSDCGTHTASPTLISKSSRRLPRSKCRPWNITFITNVQENRNTYTRNNMKKNMHTTTKKSCYENT